MPVYKNNNSGTWYAKFNYKDWQGNIRQKKKEGFKTKKEAKAFEVDFLNKSQASNEMLFSSLYKHYFEYCESRLKPTTLANKMHLIEVKILPYFNNMPLNTIEASTVMKWQNELLKLGYSETYLKTIHNQLSAIFNFACKFYKLSSNPARQCGSMGKKNANSMDFWTLSEFKKFIGHVSDKPQSEAAFNMLFWTGMRSGELLALTKGDFDFIEGTVSISKGYTRLNGEDLIQTPKTPKSIRSITIPRFVLDIIERYISCQYDLESDERVFYVTKHYLSHEMKRGCKLSGVKKIRVHDLRHSHASLLIEQGYSPLLISERLGHEHVETTLETYSHLYPDKHGEVAERLDSLNKKYENKQNNE